MATPMSQCPVCGDMVATSCTKPGCVQARAAFVPPDDPGAKTIFGGFQAPVATSRLPAGSVPRSTVMGAPGAGSQQQPPAPRPGQPGLPPPSGYGGSPFGSGPGAQPPGPFGPGAAAPQPPSPFGGQAPGGPGGQAPGAFGGPGGQSPGAFGGPGGQAPNAFGGPSAAPGVPAGPPGAGNRPTGAQPQPAWQPPGAPQPAAPPGPEYAPWGPPAASAPPPAISPSALAQSAQRSPAGMDEEMAGVPPTTLPPGSTPPVMPPVPRASDGGGRGDSGGRGEGGGMALQRVGGGPGAGMANLAARLPSSQPGTLFGVPLSRLRDAALEQKVLLISGVALLVSIVIPYMLSPVTVFAWDLDTKFRGLVWPILAGLSYLLVAVAPPNIKQNVPPVVLKWLPFGFSFASILIGAMFGGAGSMWLANIGYPFLVFALLATLANPQDQIARTLVAVGAGIMLVPWVAWLRVTFNFDFPVLDIVHNLLQFLVFTAAVASALFVVPPEKLPPALQGVDVFKPLVTAVLLAWLPLSVVFWLLAQMVAGNGVMNALLGAVHSLINIVAYFGVLLITAPDAYEELKKLFAGGGAPRVQPQPSYGAPQPVSRPPAQPGAYPPPGGQPAGYPGTPGFPHAGGPAPGGYPGPGAPAGGYSPPGPGGMQPGGYPPPGGMQPGGYPPPGMQPGGMPPGGYPPPGGFPQPGGYPPPGGMQPGGYPPPGPGGYPPPGPGGMQPGGYPPPGPGGMQPGGYPPPGGMQPGGYPPAPGGYPPPGGGYPPAGAAPGPGGYPPPGGRPPWDDDGRGGNQGR